MPEDGPDEAERAMSNSTTADEFSSIASELSTRFVQGLRAAAIAQGLDPDQASRITYQTVTGSVALAQESTMKLSEMVAAVASPGGCTQAGLAVLGRDDGLDRIVADAFSSLRTGRNASPKTAG